MSAFCFANTKENTMLTTEQRKVLAKDDFYAYCKEVNAQLEAGTITSEQRATLCDIAWEVKEETIKGTLSLHKSYVSPSLRKTQVYGISAGFKAVYKNKGVRVEAVGATAADAVSALIPKLQSLNLYDEDTQELLGCDLEDCAEEAEYMQREQYWSNREQEMETNAAYAEKGLRPLSLLVNPAIALVEARRKAYAELTAQ
jgi:hypothetical protein